jgi:hypothetical protein
MYGLVLARTDPAESAGTVGARLRTAWTSRDPAERLEAIRSLWDGAESPPERHARLILTAGAAARIPPDSTHAADAPNLIASLLSTGLDRRAAAWSRVAEESGDQRAWAMIAAAAPRPSVDLGRNRIQAFIEADDSAGRRRSAMLVAALAGLGRIPEDDASRFAASVGGRLGDTGVWASAIDRAAGARERGTVALLAGIGMQTGDWRGVPPAHLFRIVRALRAVGLEYEARMIAAEAVARL